MAPSRRNRKVFDRPNFVGCKESLLRKFDATFPSRLGPKRQSVIDHPFALVKPPLGQKGALVSRRVAHFNSYRSPIRHGLLAVRHPEIDLPGSSPLICPYGEPRQRHIQITDLLADRQLFRNPRRETSRSGILNLELRDAMRLQTGGSHLINVNRNRFPTTRETAEVDA